MGDLASNATGIGVGDWWQFILVAVALVGVAGVGIPAIRTQRAKGTIDLQAAQITAYEKAITDMQGTHSKEIRELEDRCRQREHEMERRHMKEIGELRGRIDAMTPEFAGSLASQIADNLRKDGIRA